MMRIPVILVTGFLGSGKTTLLHHMLLHYGEKLKIGIVQNEFAPAGMDGARLQDTGIKFSLLEMNNGSVFCICLLPDFMESLRAFAISRNPDLIIIESSGLSDPMAIASIFESPLLKDQVYLASTWCIVDPVNFTKKAILMNRIRNQLLVADKILINKKDIADQKDLDDTKVFIKELNNLATVFETSFCEIPSFELFDFNILIPIAYRLPPFIHEPASTRPPVISGVFKTGRKIKYTRLHNLIYEYIPQMIRIKGFVVTRDKGTLSVQTVYNQVDLKEIQRCIGSTTLILMGENFQLSIFSRKFRQLCE